MKKTALFIAFILFFSIWTFGQIDQMRKKIEDVGVESQGLFTLRFDNASEGTPVAYATIAIQGNKSMLTDAEGKIRFEKKPDGVYPFKFEKKGFISEEFQIKINSGKIVNNRFIVSSTLKKDEFRIVLFWDDKPADLDLHFIKDEKYRVSSKDLKKSPDSLVVLECETVLGYGPESIYISNMSVIDSTMVVVNDYSNKTDENSVAISKSDAVIKIYSAGKIEGIWKPSKKQKGNVWMGFTIHNGKITPTEEVMKY